jgi:hypothetical protein
MRQKYKSHKMRDISDLRIQSICEFQYFLKSKHGNTSSIASIRGEWLHSKIGIGNTKSLTKQNPMVKIIIITIAILFVLFLYIFG